MQLIRISAVWCMSCLYTYPIYQSIRAKYPEIEYIEYDYDQQEEEIKAYHVGEILPVHILMKDGKEMGRLIGEKREVEFIAWLKEVKN